MQYYIRSFILGILIAVSALLLQVFFSIIFEVVRDEGFSLSYFQKWELSGIMLFFAITAVIEEFVRYSIILAHQRKNLPALTSQSIIIHGALLGAGFTSFEYLLSKMGDLSPYFFAIFFVFATHIIVSTYIIFSVSRKLPHILTVAIAILLHILLNLANYILFT